jgi:type III pantothenate kinase
VESKAMDDRNEQILRVLACDVGNTHVHLAQVTGQEVQGRQTLRLDEPQAMSEALAALWQSQETSGVGKLAACSVNPPGLEALEAAAAATLKQQVLVVGRDLPLPIETNLSHPAGIGTDRLCAAAAAYDHLGVACVVADFGSAVTIDCVDGQGVFQGGAILPGLRMGATSLGAHTAQLPQVVPATPTWVFGRNTQEAIIGGLVYGARGAMRELIEAYATQLGHWPMVILTGGDARMICGEPNKSSLVQAIVDNLVLCGVAIAYYKTLAR